MLHVIGLNVDFLFVYLLIYFYNFFIMFLLLLLSFILPAYGLRSLIVVGYEDDFDCCKFVPVS